MRPTAPKCLSVVHYFFEKHYSSAVISEIFSKKYKNLLKTMKKEKGMKIALYGGFLKGGVTWRI
jgi:hypothetical protein